MNEKDKLLLGIVVLIVVIILIVSLAVRIDKFITGRCFLKFRIEQAADEEEYKYWRRELLVLYILLIPGTSSVKAEKIADRIMK